MICTPCRDLFLSLVLIAIYKDNYYDDFHADLVGQKRSLARGNISIPMGTPIILLRMKPYLSHQPVKRYTAQKAEIAAAIFIFVLSPLVDMVPKDVIVNDVGHCPACSRKGSMKLRTAHNESMEYLTKIVEMRCSSQPNMRSGSCGTSETM